MNKKNRDALKGFRPPLTFVQLLGLLVALLKEPGIRNEGIKVDELDAMKTAEEADGKRIKGMEGQYLVVYGAFLRDEEGRWSRYMEVLETLRARYRKDPVMLLRLDALKRNTNHPPADPSQDAKPSEGENHGKVDPPKGEKPGEEKPPAK